MFAFLKTAGNRWLSGWKRRTCDRPQCTRWLSVSHLETRRVGVQLGETWYCSYACFYSAAEEQFSEIVGARSNRPIANLSMTLGLELVARGLLTPEQLRIADGQHQAEGVDVDEIFIQNGFVTEAQLTKARAAMWGCPVYNPPSRAAKTGIVIPSALAAPSLAVPMHYVGATKQLLLGFVRSVDYELMFALEKMTGCTAKATFIRPSDFLLNNSNGYQKAEENPETANEKTFTTPLTSSERAHILCKYGSRLNANQVKITLCKNYLWARLFDNNSSFDLLFKID